MNCLRRARSRPRVRSFNFRSLWWVLIREALLHELGSEQESRPGSWYRGALARYDDAKIRRNFEKLRRMRCDEVWL